MCDSADPTDIIIRDNLIHGMIGGINFWGSGFCEAGEGETPRVEDDEISDNQFYDLGITGVQQGFGVLLEGLSSWSDAGNEFAALVEGNTFADIYSKDGANVKRWQWRSTCQVEHPPVLRMYAFPTIPLKMCLV